MNRRINRQIAVRIRLPWIIVLAGRKAPIIISLLILAQKRLLLLARPSQSQRLGYTPGALASHGIALIEMRPRRIDRDMTGATGVVG